MSYVVAAHSGPNPVLRLRRGERVRFVLTNDDPGVFAQPCCAVLGLATPLLPKGRTHTAEVHGAGRHRRLPVLVRAALEMMRGNIAIE